MKIADFFRKPIKTYVEINGVEVDVMVDADCSPCDPSVGIFAEQVEVCAVRDDSNDDRLDELLVHDLEDLGQRLLAMARSAHESRVEDAREFARECRDEALAMGQSQRGFRV